MAQVSYPGVYIDEVSSGVHTISSVATSIAAFIGRATRGPLDKAVRCLSYADYERAFGVPLQQSDLATSIKQFFNNGGSDCYVVRIANGATPAKVTIKSLAGTNVLVATAKSGGEWGNNIRIEVDYNTRNPHDSFNMRVLYEEGGSVVSTESYTDLSMNPASPRYAQTFVTQSSLLIDLQVDAAVPANPTTDGFSQSRRPLGTGNIATFITAFNALVTASQNSLVISVNNSVPRTVTFGPGPITSLNDIKTAFSNVLNTLSPVETVNVTTSTAAGGRMLRIEATSGSKTSVQIQCSAMNDIAAALMIGVGQGGIESTGWSHYRPAPNATLQAVGTTAPGDLSKIDLITAITQDSLQKLTIGGSGTVTLNPPNSLVTTSNGDPWYVNKVGQSTVTGDSDGVREKLRIIATAINNDSVLSQRYRAEVWGYHLAIVAKSGSMNEMPTSVDSTATLPATQQLFSSVTAPSNVLINTRQYCLGLASPSAYTAGQVLGTNGTTPLVQANYLGVPAAQTGMHALDVVDLFNLMVIPSDEALPESVRETVWAPASNYCQSRRAFLLVDAPVGWTDTSGRPVVTGATSKVDDLRLGLAKNNAGVFYPRLTYNKAGLVAKIGASGAVAGLIARTDASRGVWKAPAGIEADIREVLGVDVKLTDNENGVLNKKGVNCLRVFPNGLVNWGARTLDGDDDFGSEWKYIPIRRLALNIEESLFRGTKWVVFEPNDEPLWAKIRLNINAYMMSLFRQGAFQGTSPKDAFYVKCDKETTTQDDRNKGIVNIEVGFAPLKPAEFVVIKLQQIAGNL